MLGNSYTCKKKIIMCLLLPTRAQRTFDWLMDNNCPHCFIKVFISIHMQQNNIVYGFYMIYGDKKPYMKVLIGIMLHLKYLYICWAWNVISIRLSWALNQTKYFLGILQVQQKRILNISSTILFLNDFICPFHADGIEPRTKTHVKS